MANLFLPVNSGYLYVTQVVGFPDMYKIGETKHSTKARLRNCKTFTPNGIDVIRESPYFDRLQGEKNVHARLAAWHVVPQNGGGKEIFRAPLKKIHEELDAELLQQKVYFRSQADGFDQCRKLGLTLDIPSEPGKLNELLDGMIMKNIRLRDAIIMATNSTTVELKLMMALGKAGVSIDSPSRTATILCSKTLAKIVADQNLVRRIEVCLEEVSHFNSMGLPVYS